MTVIAAYFDSPTNYAIGADSACVAGTTRFPSLEKLTRWGDVIFGCTGETALCQRAARFLTGHPAPETRDDLDAVLLALHDHLLTRVAPPQPNAGTANTSFGLLSVGPWGIVELDCAGGLHRAPRYVAIGSGAVAARAAMWSLEEMAVRLEPSPMVEHAVEAGIAFDTGCAEPVVVLRGSGSKA